MLVTDLSSGGEKHHEMEDAWLNQPPVFAQAGDSLIYTFLGILKPTQVMMQIICIRDNITKGVSLGGCLSSQFIDLVQPSKYLLNTGPWTLR